MGDKIRDVAARRVLAHEAKFRKFITAPIMAELTRQVPYMAGDDGDGHEFTIDMFARIQLAMTTFGLDRSAVVAKIKTLCKRDSGTSMGLRTSMWLVGDMMRVHVRHETYAPSICRRERDFRDRDVPACRQ